MDQAKIILVAQKPWPEPADWKKLPFMLAGSHYKCGTETLQELVVAMAITLAEHDPAGHAPYYKPHGWGREAGIGDAPIALNFAYPAEYTYANLTGRPFRLFHSIRDPIEMTISAYWYIRRQSVPFDLGWGPSQIVTLDEYAKLLSADVITGLEITARGVLNTEIKDIRGLLKASRGDARVVTVSLEDIEDNFNRTIGCMHRFLMEPIAPKLYKALASSLLDGAQLADSGSHQASVDENAIHFNSDENKVISRNLIAASTNPVWDELREVRREFGYQATGDGRYRRPWPSQCLFAEQTD